MKLRFPILHACSFTPVCFVRRRQNTTKAIFNFMVAITAIFFIVGKRGYKCFTVICLNGNFVILQCFHHHSSPSLYKYCIRSGQRGNVLSNFLMSSKVNVLIYWQHGIFCSKQKKIEISFYRIKHANTYFKTECKQGANGLFALDFMWTLTCNL